MEPEIITVLEIIQTIKHYEECQFPQEFSITFCTANRKTGTGGELIRLEECLVAKNQLGKKLPRKQYVASGPARALKRDPDNYKNRTVNIIHKPSDRFFCVHYRLITEFNGKTVTTNSYA